MLTEFDQSTIANMTAALDFVCKKIAADRDSNELRKRIADELMHCARTDRHSLVDFEKAGMKIVEDAARHDRSSWLAWLLGPISRHIRSSFI
jgi:ketopantoate reductase